MVYLRTKNTIVSTLALIKAIAHDSNLLRSYSTVIHYQAIRKTDRTSLSFQMSSVVSLRASQLWVDVMVRESSSCCIQNDEQYEDKNEYVYKIIYIKV
jgi:hypothetical protein